MLRDYRQEDSLAPPLPTILPTGQQSRHHFRGQIKEQARYLHQGRMAEDSLRPTE